MVAINPSFAVAALLSVAAAIRLHAPRPDLALTALAVPAVWLLLAALAQLAVMDRAATGRVAESDLLLERLRRPALAVALALTATAVGLLALSLRA